MAHVRKLIRDNVVSTITGLATTGANVFRSRVYANEETKLPCLCVYTLNEAAERTAMNGNQILRELEVLVEAYAKAKADLDNTLDNIAVEVEEALAVDPTRNGNALSTYLTSTEMNFEEGGEQPVGIAKLTFVVQYVTTSTDVEQAV